MTMQAMADLGLCEECDWDPASCYNCGKCHYGYDEEDDDEL